MGETREDLLYQAGDAVHEAAASVTEMSEKARARDDSNVGSGNTAKS